MQFYRDWQYVVDSMTSNLVKPNDNADGEIMSRYWGISTVKEALANITSYEVMRKTEEYVRSVTDTNSVVAMVVTSCSHGRHPMPVPRPDAMIDSAQIRKQLALPVFHIIWIYKNADDTIHVVRVNNRIELKIIDVSFADINNEISQSIANIPSGFMKGNTSTSGTCHTMLGVWTERHSAIIVVNDLIDCDASRQHNDRFQSILKVFCLVSHEEYFRGYWKDYY